MSKESLHVLVVINIFWNVFGKAGTGITLILMNYHSMIQVVTNIVEGTVQKKNKVSIKDFFSKCDQIHSFWQIWLHLLKKFLIDNFFFCAV